MKRLWFVPKEGALYDGWWGLSPDEYGHQTYWVRVPCLGIIVLRGHRLTREEILDQFSGDEALADWLLREYKIQRIEDGVDT